MLVIRTAQLEIFREIAAQNFEDEMMVHSRNFAPQVCEALSDDELRSMLRSAIAQSGSYGFSDRGPVRTYIELMLLLPSGFDTDKHNMAIREILKSSDDQMARAELLYEYILNYQADYVQD